MCIVSPTLYISKCTDAYIALLQEKRIFGLRDVLGAFTVLLAHEFCMDDEEPDPAEHAEQLHEHVIVGQAEASEHSVLQRSRSRVLGKNNVRAPSVPHGMHSGEPNQR